VVALLSGDGGLSATAAIVAEAAEVLERGGLLAMEVDERRASTVADLVRADARYTDVMVRLDLAGRDRYVTAVCGS
jgi:release factor glutamine methyltransferase